MFTLKFYNAVENAWNVFACPHYELCFRKENDRTIGAAIVMYNSFTCEGGIEYHIGIDDRGYDTFSLKIVPGRQYIE